MGVEKSFNTAEEMEQNIEALLEAARYADMDDVMSSASSGVPLDSKDSEGRTALHMAAANGHLDIVDYLITNRVVGVNEKIDDDNNTVEQDVNATNVEKNTPLHWACLNGHIEVVKSLILSGANLSLLNSHEKSPVDEAVSGGKLDVINAINTAVAQLELANATVS